MMTEPITDKGKKNKQLMGFLRRIRPENNLYRKRIKAHKRALSN